MDTARDPQRLCFDTERLARLQPWLQRHVDRGRIPGASLLIARHGELAYAVCLGDRDVEAAAPWQRDTIVRMYSMTKPVTSVALMMLYEEGLVHLDDPVETILPEFKDLRVLVAGAKSLADTIPAKTKMTVRHLLTHTSGLSYGMNGGLLGEAYGKEALGIAFSYGGLDKMVRRIAELPLEFEPGSRWHYSVASDVVGRIVEVVSGRSLDQFFAKRILQPLGMAETGFDIPEAQIGRFAALYTATTGGGMTLAEAPKTAAQRQGKVNTFQGGSGLVGTIDDYWRFAEMLRAGGAYKGARLISPRTLALMTANHLPGDISSMGPATWAETSFDGVGFGLLGTVLLDPAKAQTSGSPGDYGWGGAASTYFWVSPRDDLVVILLTQLAPSSALPIRKELRALVYGALVE